MKNKKIYKQMFQKAKEMLLDVSDEDLNSFEGMQNTMNQFLVSQGLPAVGIPGVGSSDSYVPDRRSFDEISDELSDFCDLDDGC